MRSWIAVGGVVMAILLEAQNKIQDPAELYRLVGMVDETQRVLSGLTKAT